MEAKQRSNILHVFFAVKVEILSDSNHLRIWLCLTRLGCANMMFQAFEYFKEQQRRLAVESGITPEQVEATQL